jgi:hypothetical protein
MICSLRLVARERDAQEPTNDILSSRFLHVLPGNDKVSNILLLDFSEKSDPT